MGTAATTAPLPARAGHPSGDPYRRDQHPGGPLDRTAYRDRNRIERSIGRLKQLRRVATRYEKRAANYQAMATLAAITLWL